jgi:predicted RNA-binding Zn-ribbon protein involved in translation (DUF1610 family)
MSTLKTKYFNSNKSAASCAACKTPAASYSHVNFDCPDLGTPIIEALQDELKSSLNTAIDFRHDDPDRPQLSSIINTLKQIKDRFLLYKSMVFQHPLDANP